MLARAAPGAWKGAGIMKQVIFFAFEGAIYIYLALAVAHGHKVFTGLVIAYFFIWQATHRSIIKRQDKTIEKILQMQLDHNSKMLDIGKGALNGKEKV